MRDGLAVHDQSALASSDKVWPTANFFRKLAVGDQLAVYMKETGGACDGIYIVGDITAVDQDGRRRSASRRLPRPDCGH